MNWSVLAGKFIVFDGADGSGKSTHLARFAESCREAGLTVCTMREPGGTRIGEDVRRVLLTPTHAAMDVSCEAMLYMACRAQLVVEVIRPAIERGELGLADRFISSTLAYQGTAGGVPLEAVNALGRVAIGATRPDLTVIFDVDETVAQQRLGPDRDRVERKGIAYQAAVRRGFLDQTAADPDHYLLIETNDAVDAVFKSLTQRLLSRF